MKRELSHDPVYLGNMRRSLGDVAVQNEVFRLSGLACTAKAKNGKWNWNLGQFYDSEAYLYCENDADVNRIVHCMNGAPSSLASDKMGVLYATRAFVTPFAR